MESQPCDELHVNSTRADSRPIHGVAIRGHRDHIVTARPARPFGEGGPAFELGGGATPLREFGVIPEAGSATTPFDVRCHRRAAVHAEYVLPQLLPRLVKVRVRACRLACRPCLTANAWSLWVITR